MKTWDEGADEIPLTADHMREARGLAARMVGGILLSTKDELTVEAFGAMAVEMAFAVMNQTRQYCLKDGRIVRKTDA